MATKKARPKAKPKAKPKQMRGWLILHPNGLVETDYFQSRIWTGKNMVRISREVWRQTYRSKCTMVRATLNWNQ